MNLLISRNRLQGYKTALLQAGIPIDQDFIISSDSPEDTEQSVYVLLNSPSPPDGIFAISDLTMTGVMKAIFKKNIKVPNEISVIGFCEEPFRSMYNPQLTTIEPMGFEIGFRAAELLFERIQDNISRNSPSQVIFIDSHLKEGGSI